MNDYFDFGKWTEHGYIDCDEVYFRLCEELGEDTLLFALYKAMSVDTALELLEYVARCEDVNIADLYRDEK